MDSSGQLNSVGHLDLALKDDEVTKLVAPEYASNVLSGFRLLQTGGCLTDFTIVVENEEFQVHKALFASISDYFRALFTRGMKESLENKVVLDDLPLSGVKKVIEFVYSGELDVCVSTIGDIVACASRLQINLILDLCSDYLEDKLSVDTCIDILTLAEMYGISRALETTRHFLLHHFTLIANNLDDFKRFSKEQLVSFLKDNSLKCHSEFELFKVVLPWIYASPERIADAGDILRYIRFPLMSPEELVDTVPKELIMQNCAISKSLLSEAEKYHFYRHVKRMQADITTERTHVRNKPGVVAVHQMQGLSILMGNNWMKLADISHETQSCATATVNNFLYLCGGFVEGVGVTTNCFCFDPRFMELTRLASLNEPRMSFPLVSVEKTLYAIGGSKGSPTNEARTYTTVETYSIKDDHWSFCSRLPVALEKHAACEFLRNIYVSGGLSQPKELPCDLFYSFDTATKTWTQLPSMLMPHARHFMTTVGDKICVVDGGRVVPNEQIEYFNLSSNQWTSIECGVNIIPPLENCVTVYGNWIYFVCPRWGTTVGGRTFRFNILSLDLEELGPFPGDKLKNRLTLAVLTLPQHVVPLLKELEVKLRKLPLSN